MKIRKFKLILLTVLFSLCFLTACSSKNDKIIESSTHSNENDINEISTKMLNIRT